MWGLVAVLTFRYDVEVSSIIFSRIYDISFLSNGYVFQKVQNIVRVLLSTVYGLIQLFVQPVHLRWYAGSAWPVHMGWSRDSSGRLI